MKTTSGVAVFSCLLLAVGCAYKNPPAGSSEAYGYGTGKSSSGNEVISSPASSGQATAPATSQATPSPSPTTTSSASSVPPVYSSSSSSTAPPAGWVSEADRSLMNQVRQALDTGPMASAAPNIYVAAQNGTITLTGSVPTEQQKAAIESLVRNTPGVVAVNDQLQLVSASSQTPPSSQIPAGAQPVPPPPTPTGRDYSSQGQPGVTTATTTATGDIFNLHVQGLNETDRNLAQRILEGLRTDSQLASLMPTVNINVANGRVVLQGLVQNQQQKQTIASVVERAAGISNVDDQLRVTNP